jgi:hypothetical protein
MSADSWEICPRCLQQAQDKGIADFKKTYGYTPPIDHIPIEPEDYRTFREDYEIGLYRGHFIVNYAGQCTVCKLRLDFRESRNLEW